MATRYDIMRAKLQDIFKEKSMTSKNLDELEEIALDIIGVSCPDCKYLNEDLTCAIAEDDSRTCSDAKVEYFNEEVI